MALIECPDCGKQVSDAATSCISCGRPLRGNSQSVDPRKTRETPVLIEQSAKPFKGGMLLGVGIVILALIIGMASPTSGGAAASLTLILIGILVFIGSLVARWWHHG